MNEEPSLSDEVVVVLIDGEVVDGFLVCNRGDGNDSAPVPLQRLYKIADLHCGGVEPARGILSAFDPEGVMCAWSEGVAFALDAYLEQAIFVRRGESGDGLVS